MKLNRKAFINILENNTDLNHDECIILNKILESRLIIGKKSKNKIINDIKEQLNKDEVEAFKLYDEVSNLIALNIKEKIKHPLKKD